MKIRENVVESIRKNYREIFSSIKEENIEIENIKKQRIIGFNITYSARFICTVRIRGCKEEKSTVFVKCKNDTHKEYENIKILWNEHYFRSQKYSIPRPLFLDRNNSLLFLEVVNGEDFLKGFYRNLHKKERIKILQNQVVAAANWLVDFQSIYCSVEKKNILWKASNYKRNTEDLKWINSDEKSKINDKMSIVIRNFPQYCDTFVHNQFHIRNIMFIGNGDKVCVVDFPKLTKGWPLYDLLTFVLGIEKLELYPFITRNNCENLKEIFIKEYFNKKNISYDKELLENLWALYVITDLRKRYQNYKGIRIKGFGNNYFAYKTVKRLVEWSKK